MKIIKLEQETGKPIYINAEYIISFETIKTFTESPPGYKIKHVVNLFDKSFPIPVKESPEEIFKLIHPDPKPVKEIEGFKNV